MNKTSLSIGGYAAPGAIDRWSERWRRVADEVTARDAATMVDVDAINWLDAESRHGDMATVHDQLQMAFGGGQNGPQAALHMWGHAA